jgi:hypothetical protein
MFDAIGVERTAPADDPVNFVSLGEKKLGQIRTILAGDTGN